MYLLNLGSTSLKVPHLEQVTFPCFIPSFCNYSIKHILLVYSLLFQIYTFIISVIYVGRLISLVNFHEMALQFIWWHISKDPLFEWSEIGAQKSAMVDFSEIFKTFLSPALLKNRPKMRVTKKSELWTFIQIWGSLG